MQGPPRAAATSETAARLESAIIRATYPTAEDAVRKPERFAATTHYFVDRWLPDLGPTAASIVLYLRRCGYYNPRTGELRNEISRSQQEIGQGVGVSERTVRREFASNASLPVFIQVLPSYEQNEKGCLHKVRSIYRVMMTDPIHPNDSETVRQEDARLTAERAEVQQARVWIKRVRTDYTHSGQNGRYGETDNARSGQNDLYNAECRSGQNGRAIDSDSYPKTFEEIPKTLNVEEESTFVVTLEPSGQAGTSSQKLQSKRAQQLNKLVEALVTELDDLGSERRHLQLLEICQQRNLDALPKQALAATRKRLASEKTQGPLENPGAYYQRVLLALLEDHQVFVPKLGEPTAEEVHRLAMQSLNNPSKRKKIAQESSEPDNLVADYFESNDVGQDNLDRASALDGATPTGKLSVTGFAAFSATSPTWEELATPEKSVWQMRARQLFVENGVTAPSDRAVLHQARALREKGLREKYEEKIKRG